MAHAKVRWFDALKCDGHGGGESVMVHRAKMHMFTLNPNGKTRLSAMVTSDGNYDGYQGESALSFLLHGDLMR